MDEYFVTSGTQPPDPAPAADPVAGLPQLLHSPFVEPRSVRVLRVAGLVLLGLGALSLAALPVLAMKAVITFFESLPF